MAKTAETVKMVNCRYLVDNITINGVEHTGMKGTTTPVEERKVSTLVAHKFVEIVETEVPNVE